LIRWPCSSVYRAAGCNLLIHLLCSGYERGMQQDWPAAYDERRQTVLQSWDPFTILARLDEDFDELVRRAWGGTTTGRSAFGYVPPVDMYVDGKDVILRLELPGIDPDKDVEIHVEDHHLTISGSRKETYADTEEGERMLVREIHQGSFWRQFALSGDVKIDHITASYDKGILKVRIRDCIKRAESAKRISITKDSREPVRSIGNKAS
ncbi:MAG: Hsp20/alpha crystallin family protein, partial [Actinomycetes bacterium]